MQRKAVREEMKDTKAIRNSRNSKMAIVSPSLSVITLPVSALNSPIKRNGLAVLTARYFSNKDRFIWDQLRIVIQGLQHKEPCTGPPMEREGERFYRGGKEVGRALVNKKSWLFIGLVLARKEEFFLLSVVPSAIVAGQESSPFWSPDPVQLRFLFIIFSPFDQDFSLKALLIKSQVF